MNQMMNGKAGNHRIKPAQVGQGRVHIVFDDGHLRIPGEALSGRLQHGRRKIHRHCFRVWMSAAHQRQQTPVSGAQIKDPASTRGDELQQRRLTLAAM